MSKQAKPFTLFDLYAFLGQQLGAHPELANLYVAGMEMPVVLGAQTQEVAPEILAKVHHFYSDLDALVDGGIKYLETYVVLVTETTREEMEQVAKKGVH